MREQEQQHGSAQQSAAAQHLAEEVQQLQLELQRLSGTASKSDQETRRLQQLQVCALLVVASAFGYHYPLLSSIGNLVDRAGRPHCREGQARIGPIGRA